ncbi:Gfo/Idh/MocA family oxidoreductase [Thermatribacter velox]|uniref:Gfo/Idh/MocA family oxidoreductase n=1 Tax=Thermatribacter velox TaxID=3039681 RepID=A0ABZ2Y9Y2_9BACT
MKVRWGVIGAGGIARRRTIPEVFNYAQKSEIVAIMDVNTEVLNEMQQELRSVKVFSNLGEFLKEEMEAVYVASPVHFHYKHVLSALQSGKHVLCEKPLARTLSEAEKLASIAEQSGLRFGVAFMMRYNAYHRQIREWLSEGKLGQIVACRAQLTCWYPPIAGAWRQELKKSGGGALSDMGCHCIDLLEWLVGEVKEVFGFVDTITHNYEVEDVSSVLLKFKNGAQGFVDNYFNVPDRASHNLLEIYGTRGAVMTRHSIGQDPGGELEYYFEVLDRGYDAKQSRDKEGWQRLYLKAQPLYAQEIDDFSRWIIEGGSFPLSYEAGLRNMKVIEAIYRSCLEKRVIQV